MSLEVWRITKKGKTLAGGVTPKSRDAILDYLRRNGTGTLEQLVDETGMNRWQLKSKLREYANKDLVVEVTREVSV